ncbi:MAG: hypothetical protein ACI4PF_06005 [Christensenellales bacterium]
MSKINYYDDIKIIKKPFKQRLKSFVIIFLLVLTLLGCFGIASTLSSALTVGKLGAFMVYGDTKLKIDSSKMYAVTLGEYSSMDEAEKVALGATIQGASGYVWVDENYFVMGNIYSSNDDALKVLDNLKTSNYKVAIKEIAFPKLTLDFSMYQNSDMGTIKQAMSTFDTIYNTLYNYSIKFDKGEITHLAVSSGLSETRGEVKATIINIQNLINKEAGVLSKVQSALIKSDELLDQAIIKTIDNSSTNYSLKYSISSIVRIKYDLFNELNK